MDPARLNNFAWWCFEENLNLSEAKTLAAKGVALANPGPDKAMILDTLAEIVFQLGDSKEAASIMEKAIREDPNSKHYPKQLDRFRAGSLTEGGS